MLIKQMHFMEIVTSHKTIEVRLVIQVVLVIVLMVGCRMSAEISTPIGKKDTTL